MPFQLSEEEQLIAQTVREFARRTGLEKAAEADRFDRVPEDVLKEAAGLGLAAMAAPAEVGGAGASPTAYALAIHEMAQVCPNTATLLAVQNTVARLAALAGPAGKDLVPRLAQGEAATLLVGEEAYGSETGRFGTAATPDGGAYSLTGQKVWGLGASIAEAHVVLAEVPQAGPTALLVPADAAGVSLSAHDPIMGLRACGIRTVYLSKVRVPEAGVLGRPGAGLELLAAVRPWLQVGVAAALCGCVAGAREAASRFAETRIQFGAPIGSYQAVSDAVTSIDLQLSAGRALVLEAAARLDGPEAAAWAARAKAFANEMAIAMTRQAIRVQGGTGFMREGGTERFARDARALQFVGETTQMQRDTLKRALLPAIGFPPAP